MAHCILFVTFLCIFNGSLKCWIILYIFMHWQLHEQVQLKCNSATSCVSFSAKSGAPSCASLYIKILKFTFRGNSRCIIRCTLNCIIKRISDVFIVFSFALSLIRSMFNWPDFSSICTFKSIFKRWRTRGEDSQNSGILSERTFWMSPLSKLLEAKHS